MILGIGFYFGNSLFHKKLTEARKQTNEINGKYEQLNESYTLLESRTDTLQRVVIELAKKEHISIDNHIIDTKVKKGSTLNFVPETEANLKIPIKDSLIIKPKRKKRFFKWF
ncbi:hypothetical protein GCM10022393_00520 [Aquimarina addita]|uniref:Cell division protein FtsL n=1 Tax=Aquimarina addita TaxID=870485 RepID=A0ABP7X6T3_9FLAO